MWCQKDTRFKAPAFIFFRLEQGCLKVPTEVLACTESLLVKSSRTHGRCVFQTFMRRLRLIMDSSQNAFHTDLVELTAKLDETERQVFEFGQKGLNDLVRWQTGETQRITTSDMVVNHRKRKRAAMDQ